MSRSIDMLNVTIGWEWALGIIISLSGTLIWIAWKGSARFTALETSMEWVKNALRDLQSTTENAAAAQPAFAAQSPINLTNTGERWLVESGLKSYIDANKDSLLSACEEKRSTNPYEVQRHIFQLFDQQPLPKSVDDRVKQFAFDHGTSMPVMRRVGAIYLRNLCLDDFGMNREEIDKHDTEKQKSSS